MHFANKDIHDYENVAFLTLSVWNVHPVAFLMVKQECIPVGCVLPVAVAISQWGLPQSMLGYTPLGVGLETPLGVGLETPPRCEPGDPPPAGVGLETPLWPDP